MGFNPECIVWLETINTGIFPCLCNLRHTGERKILIEMVRATSNGENYFCFTEVIFINEKKCLIFYVSIKKNRNKKTNHEVSIMGHHATTLGM